MTAAQTVNRDIKQAIVEGMIPGRLYTLTELMESIPELADLSNQRVSSLLRQMVGSSVERVEQGHWVYFRLMD